MKPASHESKSVPSFCPLFHSFQLFRGKAPRQFDGRVPVLRRDHVAQQMDAYSELEGRVPRLSLVTGVRAFRMNDSLIHTADESHSSPPLFHAISAMQLTGSACSFSCSC